MDGKTILALVVTVTVWSSAFVGIRVGLHGYSPGSLALFRYIVASVAVFPLYFRLRNRAKMQGFDLLRFVVLGATGFAIYNVALNYGEVSVPAGIASFIVGLIPIFTMFLAIFILNEKVTPRTWVGVLISFIGMILIAGGEHAGIKFDMGVLYSLIAAIAGSVYAVMQKPMFKRYRPIEIVAYSIWFGTLIMMIYLPSLLSEVHTASTSATVAAVYMGIFPAVLSYGLWSYALSRAPASRAATYLYAMPIITTIMGYFYLKEVPASLSLTGGIIALLGAIIVNRRSHKKTHSEPGANPNIVLELGGISKDEENAQPSHQ